MTGLVFIPPSFITRKKEKPVDTVVEGVVEETVIQGVALKWEKGDYTIRYDSTSPYKEVYMGRASAYSHSTFGVTSDVFDEFVGALVVIRDHIREERGE